MHPDTSILALPLIIVAGMGFIVQAAFLLALVVRVVKTSKKGKKQ